MGPVLCGWFQRHLVALGVLARKQGRVEFQLYTGFLLSHHGFLHWITAGHSITSLENLRSDPECEIISCRWFDKNNDDSASSVPSSLQGMIWKHGDTEGADFGVVWLSPHEADLLKANPHVAPFTEESWTFDEETSWEGVYLVGYPREWRTQSIKNSGSMGQIIFRASPVGIPVIEFLNRAEQDLSDPFWRHEHCLYGRVRLDPSERQIDSIVGTSGGPLIAIRRRPDGRVEYRLIAVQSVWLRTERLIRAEPIGLIIDYLDYAFETITRRREAPHADDLRS